MFFGTITSLDNMVRFAIRSTFFFGEILKVRRNFGEAAQKFIRAAEKVTFLVVTFHWH